MLSLMETVNAAQSRGEQPSMCTVHKQHTSSIDVDTVILCTNTFLFPHLLPLDIPVDPHTIITLMFRYSGFTTSVPLAGFVALMLEVESSNGKWCKPAGGGEQLHVLYARIMNSFRDYNLHVGV